MKLVTISGPHGVGKDTIVDNLLEIFNLTNPGLLHRVRYVVSRPRRLDEAGLDDILFVSELEFEQMIKEGELAFYAKVGSYYAGTPWSELEKYDHAITNIATEGAFKLKKLFPLSGHQIYSVFLHASTEQIEKRLQSRNPDITEEGLNKKIVNDPSPNNESLYSRFDLVVENKDGELQKCLREITDKVKDFLE